MATVGETAAVKPDGWLRIAGYHFLDVDVYMSEEHSDRQCEF